MSKELFFQQRANEMMDIVDGVERGDRSALLAYAEMKKLNETISVAVKQIEPIAMNEAFNFGEKSFEHNGFNFEIRNGARRYSFKHIPEWQEASEQVKEIEERYKSAFVAKQKGLLTATQDGEEIIMPELSISKDSLIVK